MTEYTAMDPEGSPLTSEQHMALVIERVLERWVETGYRTACAGSGSIGDEPAMRRGFDQMRHLHLAEPWLPAAEAARAIAAEVLPVLAEGNAR